MGRSSEDLAERLWPENLQEVQDCFSGTAGIPVLFAHPAGRPLAACEDLSEFCRWFTRAVPLSRPCLDCGRGVQVEQLAAASGGLRPGVSPSGNAPGQVSMLHVCPLGVIDAAVPILAGGEVLGHVVTAQARPDSPSNPAPRGAEPTREAEECQALVSRLCRRSAAQMENAASGASVIASLIGALAAARRRNLRMAQHIREQSRWIQQHTMVDPVTGVANRRRFGAALEAEVLRARRYKRTLSVAVLDIEGFQRINEEFGHEIGDALLRNVAQCLSSTVRQTDLVARVGGDEFAILFPETARPEAMIALARVRAQIEDLNSSGELPEEVQLRIGLADRSEETAELLEAAAHSARRACGLGDPAG